MNESAPESNPRPNTARRSGGLSRGKVIGLILGAAIAAVVIWLYAVVYPAALQNRRHLSLNNLHIIGMALLGRGTFPAAYTQDNSGNRLLSWRVAVLPVIEEGSLAAKFNHDEPWNGPTNQPLLTQTPRVFVPVGTDRRNAGQTNILGIVGPDTVLTPNGKLSNWDVTDDPGQTIVAVELAGGGIAWSEPRDISINEFIAAMQRSTSDEGLRPVHEGKVACLFAAGNARFVATDTPPEVLRGLCTRNGGEQVALPW